MRSGHVPINEALAFVFVLLFVRLYEVRQSLFSWTAMKLATGGEVTGEGDDGGVWGDNGPFSELDSRNDIVGARALTC